MENSNKIFDGEIASKRSESLIADKCNSWDYLENEVTSLHETFEKFTNDKDKFNLILSNQRDSFNKNGIGYKLNSSFNNIYHNRNKSNLHSLNDNYVTNLIILNLFSIIN